MALVVFDQPILIFAEPEKVGFLLGIDDIAAAVGAFAVVKLRRREEGFALYTVLALVLAFIDVPLFVQLFEDFFYGGLMVGVGGADKAVVGDIETIPYRLDLGGDPIDPLLGRNAVFSGDLLDLDAVLIRAGEEVEPRARL